MTTIFEFQFDNENPLANIFQGKIFESQAINLTIEDIFKILPKQGRALEKFITVMGYEKTEGFNKSEFTPLIVTSQSNAFHRLYGPIMAAKDGQLVLCAGLINLPLNLGKKGVIPNSDGYEIEADILSTRFNGYDDTPVLNLSISRPKEDGETVILSYNFSIRFRNLDEGEKLPSAKALATMLKNKPSDLAALLGLPPQKQMTTISPKHLPVGQYKVVDYQTFTTKDGKPTGTLTLEGAVDPESGLFLQEYIDPQDKEGETYLTLDSVRMWAPSNILGALSLCPQISQDKPATFEVAYARPGKRTSHFRLHPDSVPTVQTVDEDLSLLDI